MRPAAEARHAVVTRARRCRPAPHRCRASARRPDRASDWRSESRARGRAFRRAPPRRDEPGIAEQLGRLRARRPRPSAARIAPEETGRPLVEQRRHDIDRKAVPRARAPQKSGVPPPLLAEMEIEADRDAADAEPVDQDLARRIPRPRAGERRVEGQHHRAVEPGRGEQPQLRRSGGEPEQGLVGPEKAARMRLEGQRQRPAACALARAPIAASITARWPRCTPSKLPIATTGRPQPATASGRASRHDRKGGRDRRGIGHGDKAVGRRCTVSQPDLRLSQPACGIAGISRQTDGQLTQYQVCPPSRLRRGCAASCRAPRRDGAESMAVDLSMPILVVDDYNTMIRIIRNLLKQLGFEDVDDASDGTDALAKMREQALRPRHLRLEHGADDRLRAAQAGARRSDARARRRSSWSPPNPRPRTSSPPSRPA